MLKAGVWRSFSGRSFVFRGWVRFLCPRCLGGFVRGLRGEIDRGFSGGAAVGATSGFSLFEKSFSCSLEGANKVDMPERINGFMRQGVEGVN